MRASRWGVLLVGAALSAGLTACTPATDGRWFHPSTPTIDVHASAPCPASLGKARDVPDHSAGSTTLLPSSDSPDAALRCSYRDRSLTAQTSLTARDAQRLASVVNKIDVAKPKGTTSCPNMFDSATIIAFRYGSSDDVDLWWSDSGCETLDDGRLGAFEGGNPSFYRDFMNTFDELVPRADPTDGP